MTYIFVHVTLSLLVNTYCMHNMARLFSVVPSDQDKGKWAQTEA